MPLDHDTNFERIVRVSNPGEKSVATALLSLQQSQPPSDADVANLQINNPLSYSADIPNGSTNLLSGEVSNTRPVSPDMSNGMAMPADLPIIEPTYYSRPLTMNRADDMDMAQNLDCCDTQFDFQTPDWLVGDDFDIDALNHSIMSTPAAPNASNCANVDRGLGRNAVAEPRSYDFNIHGIEELQKRWYTYIDQERITFTGQITPDGVAERTEVDEFYRVNLSQKLQSHLSDDPLPSTEFLVKQLCSQRGRPLAYVSQNLCIRMYITRFNPIFPIVHAPTFRPSTEKSLLLLSMCSVGSLFVGSSSAAAQGLKIFRRLNKAILATVGRHMRFIGIAVINPYSGKTMYFAGVLRLCRWSKQP